MAEIVRGATTQSPWTVETAKELFDRLLENVITNIAEHDRRYEERFKASADAVKAAFAAESAKIEALKATQDHTNAVQNEWRGTLTDFREKTVNRDAFEAAIKSLIDKIDRNTQDIQRIENRLAAGTGGEQALIERRKNSNWLIGIIISVGVTLALFVLGSFVTLIYFLAQRSGQ